MLGVVVAVVATTAAVFAPFASRRVDPYHDGVMLKAAMDVADGRRLFRDTFSIYGALTPWMHAVVLQTVGRELHALKLCTVALYAIVAGLMVVAWARSMPLVVAVGAWLVWLATPAFYEGPVSMLPWPSVTALVFQSAGLVAVARLASRSSAPGWAAAAGIAAVLAQLSRTPVGVLQLGATAVSLVLVAVASRSATRFRREGVAFVAAVLGTELAFVAVLWAHGALVPWWQQTVLWPRMWASGRLTGGAATLSCLVPVTRWEVRLAAGTPASFVALVALAAVPAAVSSSRLVKPRVAAVALAAVAVTALMAVVLVRDPLLVTSVVGLAVLVPVTALGVALCGMVQALRGVRPGRALAAAAMACIGVSAWPQYCPVVSYRHMAWGMAPGIGVFVYALYRLAGRRTAVAAIALSVLVGPLVWTRVEQARAKLREPLRPVRGVPLLSGMLETNANARSLEEVAKAIRAWDARHGPTPIVVIGYRALVATLASDRSNYGPVYLRREGWPETPDEREQRDRFIASRRPLIWVDLLPADEVAAIGARYGYRPYTRPDQFGGMLLAPRNP
jgi:hypothetical protein